MGGRLSSRLGERGNSYLIAQMGWENRNGSVLPTRKERNGSSVKSVYVGRGNIAQASAALTGIEKDEQILKKHKLQQEREEIESFDADLDAMCQLVTIITEAGLLTAGFHQRKREWRKRRA